jgi:hypothetical protein
MQRYYCKYSLHVYTIGLGRNLANKIGQGAGGGGEYTVDIRNSDASTLRPVKCGVLFFSLHHPNNRFENTYVCLFAPLQLNRQKIILRYPPSYTCDWADDIHVGQNVWLWYK